MTGFEPNLESFFKKDQNCTSLKSEGEDDCNLKCLKKLRSI